MNTLLTDEGYQQAKIKLADLEKRLPDIERRTDLSPIHKKEVISSYQDMRRQYRRNIKIYEEMRTELKDGAAA